MHQSNKETSEQTIVPRNAMQQLFPNGKKAPINSPLKESINKQKE